MYFFHELVRPLKKKNERQFFRIEKEIDGSSVSSMDVSEIQNTYQTYWSVIKNKNSPPALIANCMRNIIEYFFGFIENSNLNALFEKEELKGQEFEAFRRYINRESHSDAINIYDFNEFDYDIFKKGLKKIFYLSNYQDHFDKMIS